MTPQKVTRVANHIRFHRTKAGITQRELERALGYASKGPVSRHERLGEVPPLVAAIGYEIIFRTPVAEIFWGLREELEADIEARLLAMEEILNQYGGKGRGAEIVAKKLMWLWERKHPDEAASSQ